MILEKLLDRLPGHLNKEEGSNIYKVFKLLTYPLEQGNETLQTIQNWRDIDQAEGIALDKIGKDVGQPRGGYDDIEYRKRIKIKIRSNLSGGEIETLNSIATVMMGDRFQKVQEGWTLSESHPFKNQSAMLLVVAKANGVDYGIPFAEIDGVKGGGISLRWEYIIETNLDILQVGFETVQAPYQMASEVTTSIEQQQGPIIQSDIILDSYYSTATNDIPVIGAEQQETVFYYPELESESTYIAGLHNFAMAGTFTLGQEVLL